MAIASDRFNFAPPLADTAAATRGSLFKRLITVLKKSRELQAQREIARHLRMYGNDGLDLPASQVTRNDLPF